MTEGRRLSTHEATIRTAAVEVKTLTIRGKQVTQSVFRQLLREDLLDPETVALRGVPWGKVNYFWTQCPNPYRERLGFDTAHLHVVWQRGDELRRDCIGPSACARWRAFDEGAIRGLFEQRHGLFAALLCWRIAHGDWSLDCATPLSHAHACPHPVTVALGAVTHELTAAWLAQALPERVWYWLHWTIETARQHRRAWEWRYADPDYRLEEAETAAAAAAAAAREAEVRRAWARDLAEDLLAGPLPDREEEFVDALDELEAQIAAARVDVVAKHQRWRELWASLQALDQLFIAV
jgi:hypothetical protein